MHVSGHGHGASAATRTTTSDERVGAPVLPARRGRCARSPYARGRRHLRDHQVDHAPRPGTPSRPRTSRCWSRRGTCRSRCCRSRSWPRPAPTRTRWPRTWPARRRRPDAAPGAQRRDPPAGAVVHGRGARRRGARPAARGRASSWTPSRSGVALRETFARPVQGPRPARQAVRRPRAVRRLRHRGRAAAPRVRLRVRRQGGRRRGAAATTSRRWRRASGPRWSAASSPATRWSTSGSRWSTARRTASTRPTPRSRPPARWRCRRPPRRATVTLLEPVDEVTDPGAGRRTSAR